MNLHGLSDSVAGVIETPAQCRQCGATTRVGNGVCLSCTLREGLQEDREECEAKGRLRLFETLSVHLTSERSDLSYASLAHTLGIAETMVKKQLHNLRKRYRWFLRDEVAHTVENSADVEEEIRYLCAALAAATA